MNSSAHTAVNGVTVLEPITLKEPDNSVPAGAGADLAQPAAVASNPIIIIKVNAEALLFAR